MPYNSNSTAPNSNSMSQNNNSMSQNRRSIRKGSRLVEKSAGPIKKRNCGRRRKRKPSAYGPWSNSLSSNGSSASPRQSDARRRAEKTQGSALGRKNDQPIPSDAQRGALEKPRAGPWEGRTASSSPPSPNGARWKNR